MKPISELLPTTRVWIAPVAPVKKVSEFSLLADYFWSLNLVNRKGARISRGFLGMMLSPYIIKNGKERNYSRLYDLKSACMGRAE